MGRVDCWSGVNTESVGNHKEEEVLIGDYTEKTFKLWKELWRDSAKEELHVKSQCTLHQGYKFITTGHTIRDNSEEDLRLR